MEHLLIPRVSVLPDEEVEDADTQELNSLAVTGPLGCTFAEGSEVCSRHGQRECFIPLKWVRGVPCCVLTSNCDTSWGSMLCAHQLS